MSKCFLGLWGGVLFGLTYFVSNFTKYGEHWGKALGGALEWVLLGGLLTVAAMTGYTLYAAWEGMRKHTRR